MVSREVVELDFFGMEKEKRYKSTINDIQRAISKINPQLIHHVITSTSIPGFSLPVLVPESRFDSETSLPGTAPLTMFYNGKVMVFDLSNDKATNIMRMAGEAAVPKCVSNTTNSMLGNFTGELPMARKKSLQRFLAKRKARITGTDPYKMELQPYMMKR